MDEDFEIIFEPDLDFELRLTNDPEPGILADVEEVVMEVPLVIVVAHQHEFEHTTYSVYVDSIRVASFVPSELALDIVEQIRKEYGEEDW